MSASGCMILVNAYFGSKVTGNEMISDPRGFGGDDHSLSSVKTR